MKIYSASLIIITLMICSCKHEAKKQPVTEAPAADTIAELKPDSTSFKKVMDYVMKIVPGELALKADYKKENFTVSVNSYIFAGLSNAMEGKKKNC